MAIVVGYLATAEGRAALEAADMPVRRALTAFTTGWPELAPYDVMLVNGGVEFLPEPWLDQLAEGGVMLLPLGPQGGTQHIVKLTKTSTGLSREDLIPVRFVPLLPGQAREL